MATATTPQENVQLPDDNPVFGWTLQDVIHQVNEMEPDDSQNQEETAQIELVRNYLSGMTQDQRRRMLCLVEQQTQGYWNTACEMIADVAHETYNQVLRIAQGQEELPELNNVDLETVNQLRLHRNLISLRVEQAVQNPSEAGLDDNGVVLREHLLQTSPDQQDLVEQAIQESLEAHQAALLDLQKAISQTLGEKLTQALA